MNYPATEEVSVNFGFHEKQTLLHNYLVESIQDSNFRLVIYLLTSYPNYMGIYLTRNGQKKVLQKGTKNTIIKRVCFFKNIIGLSYDFLRYSSDQNGFEI